jgi:hypothetical protein
VVRYRDEMTPGDKVLVWQSGAEAGIYAIGELVTAPYEHTTDASPEEIERKSFLGHPWRVDFRYTHILLNDPILRSTLQNDPGFKAAQILSIPQGSNFRITTGEWGAVQCYLNEVTVCHIHSLGPYLDSVFVDHGFYFTRWQIASFYSELQAKGFVILTGISGTGKTKLAQYFATALPQPGPAEEDENRTTSSYQ